MALNKILQKRRRQSRWLRLPCARPPIAYIYPVSRFWLTYQRSGRLLGVVIMDSMTLVVARLRASVDGIDQGADFAQGHQVDEATAALIPAAMVGRMLEPEEAGKLIRKLERQIPKRPAAPSVRRRDARRRRAT